MAKNKFWFEVAPITYAVRKKGHDRIGVFRKRYAHITWSETTPKTTYFVSGSMPHSLSTYSKAACVSLMNSQSILQVSGRGSLSYLRVCFDNRLPPRLVRFLCICPKEMILHRGFRRWRWCTRGKALRLGRLSLRRRCPHGR